MNTHDDATNDDLVEGLRNLASEFHKAAHHAADYEEKLIMGKAAGLLRLTANKNHGKDDLREESLAWYIAAHQMLLRLEHGERGQRRSVPMKG